MVETNPLPNSPVPPEIPTTPPINSSSPKKSVLIIFLIVFIIILASLNIYLFVKSRTSSQTPAASPTPVVRASPTLLPAEASAKVDNPTANWKTYKNNEYGFEIKYPLDLTIDFKSLGFISGSDYYGKRDFNFLLYNPKIEPSHEGPASDLTGKSTREYDGYNFAFFSGDSAIKHLSNNSDLVKSGNKALPPIQETVVTVLEYKYSLYYLPPSSLPNTDKTSFWFTSFPLGNTTVMVSGNYDRNILNQILSTFKFLQ